MATVHFSGKEPEASAHLDTTEAAVKGTEAEAEAEAELPADKSCARCRKVEATHCSDPCSCYRVCAKCAMRMATGGKCRACKNFYTSFRTLRAMDEHGNPGDGNDGKGGSSDDDSGHER